MRKLGKQAHEIDWPTTKPQEVATSELNGLLCAAAEQLEEAAEDIASWGAYASDYFQEKHDLHGDVVKYKTYAALIRKSTGI